MPVSGVDRTDNNARAAQADEARAEAQRRRVEVENQRAAQQQQESSRVQGMNIKA